MTEPAKDVAAPPPKPLHANTYPKEGFSLVVDGQVQAALRDDGRGAEGCRGPEDQVSLAPDHGARRRHRRTVSGRRREWG